VAGRRAPPRRAPPRRAAGNGLRESGPARAPGRPPGRGSRALLPRGRCHATLVAGAWQISTLVGTFG